MLLLSWFLTGCGGGRSDADPLLAGVEPSALLAPHLEASRRGLEGSAPGDPLIRRDLELYSRLEQGISGRARSATAVDSLFALWRERPDHVLWPELAARMARYLGDGDRRAEIFAHPICADTSTAIGAYMQGRKLGTAAARRTWYRLARSRAHELEPFAAVWVDLKVARTWRLSGQPEESVRITLDLLPRARVLGGWLLEGIAWSTVARARMAAGELDDALLAVRLAETLGAAALPEEGAEVHLLWRRLLKADILAARSQIPQALDLYERNVEEAARLGLSDVVSYNLNHAAMAAQSIGDRERGLDLCRRGLALALADQDSLNIPRHMMNIARRHRQGGELDSCLVYQRQAEHWIAVYPHPQNVARMPLMQAEYYAQVGDYAVVDSLLRAAVARSGDMSEAEAQAELHLELIRGWMETDRPDLVYQSIETIGHLRSGTGDAKADRHVAADLNLLIGEFLTQRGEYRLAAEALDLAGAALVRRPNPMRAWTLSRNRGLLARERGSLDAAEAHFRRCVELGLDLESPELESTGRFLLGSVLLAKGRYAEARSAFPSTDPEDFVGRFKTRVSAMLLTGISHAREGRPDLALEVLGEARSACRSWSPPDLIARIDLETARSLADAGRRREAQDLLAEVATRIEGLEPETVAEELAYFNGDLRRDLVEAVISLLDSDPHDALELARRVLPRWRVSAREADAPLARPQIIFFVGRDTSFRWLIGDDGVRGIPLPGERALEDLMAPVLADLAYPDRPLPVADLERLAAILLGDIRRSWPAEETLDIVPDLALHGLPWAGLPLPGAGMPLIDHGPLTIQDRPAIAREDEGRHGPTGRLLAVGADGSAAAYRAGLPTLRHAEREVEELAAAWPAGRTDLLIGSTAARALSPRAELRSFEAIHVASHALVFEGRADRTTLLLSGEGDHALTASALRSLDLDTDLIYLSCCEAADGAGSRSAHSGLAHCLLDAGARYVVAPLVMIDDEAARDMALRFHRGWLAGKTVPDALRAAQRGLRDGNTRWSHPFYWAFYQPITRPTTAGGAVGPAEERSRDIP